MTKNEKIIKVLMCTTLSYSMLSDLYPWNKNMSPGLLEVNKLLQNEVFKEKPNMKKVKYLYKTLRCLAKNNLNNEIQP